MSQFKLYDVVALLKPLPEYNLQKGQVGSVVMVYDDTHVEVEFVDRVGNTIALCTLEISKLLLLHYESSLA
jgi:hypothetical protein